MAVTEGNDGTETGCVHFVRGRVVEVTDWPIHPSEERKLIIRAEDTLAGFVRRIPVDMVVLSVGLEPQSDARDVRRISISVARNRKGEPISEVTRCL
jgi:heterodisulfide reductase subunit A-like polyferredoxin